MFRFPLREKQPSPFGIGLEPTQRRGERFDCPGDAFDVRYIFVGGVPQHVDPDEAGTIGVREFHRRPLKAACGIPLSDRRLTPRAGGSVPAVLSLTDAFLEVHRGLAAGEILLDSHRNRGLARPDRSLATGHRAFELRQFPPRVFLIDRLAALGTGGPASNGPELRESLLRIREPCDRLDLRPLGRALLPGHRFTRILRQLQLFRESLHSGGFDGFRRGGSDDGVRCRSECGPGVRDVLEVWQRVPGGACVGELSLGRGAAIRKVVGKPGE